MSQPKNTIPFDLSKVNRKTKMITRGGEKAYFVGSVPKKYHNKNTYVVYAYLPYMEDTCSFTIEGQYHAGDQGEDDLFIVVDAMGNPVKRGAIQDVD